MDVQRSTILTWFGWPLLVLGALLVVFPPVDTIAASWPLQVGVVEWRYSFEWVLSGLLLTLLIGDALVCAVAIGFAQRISLRIMSLLNPAVAVILVIMTVDFCLNALQVRGTVERGAGLGSFYLGAMRVVGKFLCSAILLVWFGVMARRAAIQLELDAPKESEPHPLVSI